MVCSMTWYDVKPTFNIVVHSYAAFPVSQHLLSLVRFNFINTSESNCNPATTKTTLYIKCKLLKFEATEENYMKKKQCENLSSSKGKIGKEQNT